MSTRPNHGYTAKPALTWVDGFYKLLTKLLTSGCNDRCDSIFSECAPFSKDPVVAISREVDTCSIVSVTRGTTPQRCHSLPSMTFMQRL
jgi:hypothetical protein